MGVKTKLKLDWEVLFPTRKVMVGTETVILRPLSVRQLSDSITILSGLIDAFVEAGITWDNYKEYANLVKLTCVFFERAPHLVSDVTGIDEEDIQSLPLNNAVELIVAAIEVNMESRESLEKNLLRLTNLIGKVKEIEGEEKNPQ